MEVQEMDLPGVLIISPRVFADSRGFFKETYEKNRYREIGITSEFVQDNLSRSCRGTLRGLHFQVEHPQGKLVQVLRGEVFDVAVDVRRSSPSFGRWVSVTLSESNHRQLYVPPGFAHGFYVLSETADLFYKCTDFYHPQHERTLLWSDAEVGIEWPLQGEPILSAKDQKGTPLQTLECFEDYPS
ncbi:MAG: dTDP-4-dehydrorhamnose 3,5-epimerase [Planctomycetaceae bacterium]